MMLSKLAQRIETSPIITLAAEINEKIARGETVYNLTIGDFNPKVFPIPQVLEDAIVQAYRDGETNYPGAVGIASLRKAVSGYLAHFGDMHFDPADILVSSGGRPLIYAAYLSIVDKGEKVIYPAPSWNNDHYTYLTEAEGIVLETDADNFFMPTVEALKPHIEDAVLLALCSPLNPTGTVLSKERLEAICDMVLAENKRRGPDRKPLYVIVDQIYWPLTYGSTRHYNAVTLRPEMRDYTVFIDGGSKAFAGTGLRLGWGYGPQPILAKMRSVVAHMGAWAPRAGQVACGNFLSDIQAVEHYLNSFRDQLEKRLNGFYKGFTALKAKGYNVDAIEPQAAMYLTVKLDLAGSKTADGTVLETNQQVHRYILDEAHVGLVPFAYFGASESSPWYRLSVGTAKLEDVESVITNLDAALGKLQ